jgi:hypothetical protein
MEEKPRLSNLAWLFPDWRSAVSSTVGHKTLQVLFGLCA